MMLTLEAIAKELTGTVRDIMTKNVHTAKANSSVVDAADLMAQHNVRHLVVMSADGRVAGVVSQRDVLKHYACPQAEDISEDSDSTTTDEIQHLITRERPVTVSPNVPLFKAAFVLATKRVGCLPVIGSQEQLVGILTITDLLGHLTGRATGSLESSFRFFSPSADARTKMPAFIRKMNGDLVIPLACLESEDKDLTYDEVLVGLRSGARADYREMRGGSRGRGRRYSNQAR